MNDNKCKCWQAESEEVRDDKWYYDNECKCWQVDSEDVRDDKLWMIINANVDKPNQKKLGMANDNKCKCLPSAFEQGCREMT